MTEPASEIRPNATYQDVHDAPAGMVAELVGGALHLQPRPRARHAVAASRLGVKIGGPFDLGDGGPGGWWIIDEPELHLGADVLLPDLAGWRRPRLETLPDQAFTLAPDWLCEVLSPRTREFDLTEKRDRYAAAGVAHLWFVDPDARTLEAFALEGGRWVLIRALHGQAGVALPPFEAVPFDLAVLWA